MVFCGRRAPLRSPLEHHVQGRAVLDGPSRVQPFGLGVDLDPREVPGDGGDLEQWGMADGGQDRPRCHGSRSLGRLDEGFLGRLDSHVGFLPNTVRLTSCPFLPRASERPLVMCGRSIPAGEVESRGAQEVSWYGTRSRAGPHPDR